MYTARESQDVRHKRTHNNGDSVEAHASARYLEAYVIKSSSKLDMLRASHVPQPRTARIMIGLNVAFEVMLLVKEWGIVESGGAFDQIIPLPAAH